MKPTKITGLCVSGALLLAGCGGGEPIQPSPNAPEPTAASSSATAGSSSSVAVELADRLKAAYDKLDFYTVGENWPQESRTVATTVDSKDRVKTKAHIVETTPDFTLESYEFAGEATYVKQGDIWEKLGPPTPLVDYSETFRSIRDGAPEVKVAGNEDKDGKQTKHYMLDFPFSDDWEIWVDDDGNLIEIHYGTEAIHRFSKLNVPNDIKPPI